VQLDIRHEPERSRFVVEVEGTTSWVRYAVAPGTLDLLSTFVHPTGRGRFIGERLVKRALDWAQGNGWQVIPTCWFVDTVVRRNPQYRELLVGG
jgi:predicted GNAT family acetyltransferase